MSNRQAGTASTQPVEIRAFFGANPQSGIAGITELRGAKCTLSGSGFSAAVSPPEIVNLPLIDGKPVDVTVSCKAVLGASELSTTDTFGPDDDDPSKYGDRMSVLFIQREM